MSERRNRRFLETVQVNSELKRRRVRDARRGADGKYTSRRGKRSDRRCSSRRVSFRGVGGGEVDNDPEDPMEHTPVRRRC